MALNIKRPLGTEDVTPQNINKWQTVETIVKDVAETFGFKEIRVPTFENTELFERSVGDTTDVVQKEMYSVKAKESEFTLRPEGTAGTIRAMVQNGLLNDALPQKVFYVLSCFRHERPQAGRLREFHQFGVEMAGSQSPYADAEVVSLAKSIIDRTGLKGIALNVNSIGCPTCRAEYHKALKSYFANRQDELCDTCKSRLEKNPMRILDCKSPICQDIAKDAPVILDYLCEDCSTHFEKFKSILTSMGIEYSVNPKIVRGLDYYTKTVFEFVTTDIGAQGTVCGGGRYDGLIEQLSGKHVPALGFGMGLERLILTMESQGCDFMESPTCDLYIATMGETAKDKAVQLASLLREEGYLVEYDLMDRGIKAQMKYANKLKSKFVVVLGDNEIESQTAKLKDMASGEETPITLGEKFLESFSSVYMANMMSFED
jgi:histidyl-tRNA synthetase